MAHPSPPQSPPRHLPTPVSPSRSTNDLNRQSIPNLQPSVRLQTAPSSPVSVSPPRQNIQSPETATFRGFGVSNGSRPPSRGVLTPDSGLGREGEVVDLPIRSRPSSSYMAAAMHSRQSSDSGVGVLAPRIEETGPDGQQEDGEESVPQSPGLRYHAFDEQEPRKKQIVQNRTSQGQMTAASHRSSHSGSSGGNRDSQLLQPNRGLQRPASTYTLGSELRGRTLSPFSANGSDGAGSPRSYARDVSSSRRSPSSRPMSYIDLLSNVPYNQQVAPQPPTTSTGLRDVVGTGLSIMDTKKTLEMYRLNVKKTNDAAVQYEFAIFMVNAAQSPSAHLTASDGSTRGLDSVELITEAKHILQRLADRAYPFGQYYLADGYSSGLFTSKGKPDHDKAFPLFVAAAKHGHAEAGYRAGLSYEFGWGTARSAPKAVQFYRNSASKNHPGAATRLGLACLRGDLGLGKEKRREGLKWLRRAQEVADQQYNSAPYELALLHLHPGELSSEIFVDEPYASQLLTQAAELGHVEASFMMGRAYEEGLYACPRDPALSVHFYNGAATRGHVEGMMALCAWFMVGAPPVLERDEGEAYAWATQAAELGFPKAQYACGYFTEMGIGCRRDPLQANVWYVAAADQGYEAAKQRLSIIRAAVAGEVQPAVGVPMAKERAKTDELNGKKGEAPRKKVLGIF
ncbi:Chitin synthase 4 [Elasticomyces elasticus]|nr:Chitin synthase 4 [Elasticomyces elasticus]